MRQYGPRHQQNPIRASDMPGILGLATTGFGVCWAILASVKFFLEPFVWRLREMDLSILYYICLALAAIHLADGIVHLRHKAREPGGG